MYLLCMRRLDYMKNHKSIGIVSKSLALVIPLLFLNTSFQQLKNGQSIFYWGNQTYSHKFGYKEDSLLLLNWNNIILNHKNTTIFRFKYPTSYNPILLEALLSIQSHWKFGAGKARILHGIRTCSPGSAATLLYLQQQ